MPNADVAWVDILPSMKGFGTALTREVGSAATVAGRTAGTQYGTSFGSGAVSGVEAASAKMKAALRGVEDAAGKVRIAEQRLQDLRQSGKATATQLVTAEENLARAKRGTDAANENVAASTRRLQAAQDQHTAAQRTSSAAMDDGNKKAGLLTRTFGSLHTAVYAGFAAFAAAGAAVRFIGGTISAARDLNEETNKTSVVFGSSARAVLDFSKTAASSLGQSQETALRAAGTFGNLFRAIGITESSSATMSIQLVKTASDLASFNNASPEEVLEAMRAGLVGETEPLRRFGINLSDATMRAELLAQGVELQSGPLTAAQKAQAAYSLILKQSTLAQGDFARTSDSLANQQRILSAEWTDAKAKLGALLLGPMTAVVHWATASLIPAFEKGWTAVTAFFGVFSGNGSAALNEFSGPTMDRIVTAGTAAREVWDRLAASASFLWGVLKAGAGFFADNEWALWALTTATVAWYGALKIGSAVMAVEAVGGLRNWIAQTNIATTVTKVWTGVQWLLNAAFLGFPVIWIALAIAAVIAAIVLLWQNSETFRDIVLGVWDAVQTAIAWAWENVIKPTWAALQAAWAATVDAIAWAWSNVLKPTWDALSTAATWLWENILRPTFAFIAAAWSALVTAIQWAWENVLKPVWDVLQTYAMLMFNFLKVVIFGPILVAWLVLTTGIQLAWENVLKPVWDAIQVAAAWLWENILRPIWNAMSAAWDAMVAFIKAVWDNVLKPTWDAIAAAAGWLWNTILAPIFGAVGSAWDALMRGMNAVWENVLHPAFNAIAAAVDFVKRAFDTAMEGINAAWDRIKAIVAAPINFVIRTVLRDGLFSAWNWVLDQLGIQSWKIDLTAGWLQGIAGYAVGGRIPGHSPTDTADDIPIWATAGEYMQPVPAVDYYGVDAMEAIRQRKAAIYYSQGGQVSHVGAPGYATGGELFALVKSFFPNAKSNSTYRPGDPGLHGSNQAVDIGEVGFVGGNGRPLFAEIKRFLVDTYGRSNEIIYNGLGNDRPNIKNGNAFPYSQLIQDQHHNHVHWGVVGSIMSALGAGPQGAGTAGQGGIAPLIDFFGKLSGAIGRIAEIGKSPFFGAVAELPKKLLGGMWDLIKDTVASFFASGTTGDGDNSAPAGLNAVKSAVQSVFALKGWGGGNEWAALDWLVQKESSWNPKAQNPTSTASGLFQHIDATWRAYRPAGVTAAHMKDATVSAQAQAGMEYIADKYGDPLGAKSFHQTHGWYGSGGLVQLLDGGGLWQTGLGLNLVGTERVLSPEDDGYFRRFVDATEALTAPSAGVPVWHFYLGDEEITRRVDARLEIRNEHTALDLRSTRRW